jgi:dTDP-4-dehydrorhamnose reductase
MPAEWRRILLFGGSGQIGAELRRTLERLGNVIAPPRTDCDFEHPERLPPVVAACRPALIVNAAAYTAVDDAEVDEVRCRVVNADAPGVLARAAAKAGAVLVHYSTDYVFDGTKGAPYEEHDVPAPLNAYGRSKLEGERLVTAAHGRHLVFRTSWVYAAHGRNFVRTIERAARERSVLQVVDDQRGAPTWARDVADATRRICEAALDGVGRPVWGVYHLTASGDTSWCGLARAIVAELASCGEVRLATVVPITSSEYPQRARRPADSRLSCQRAASTFGEALPHWRQSLRAMMRESAHAGATGSARS